MRQFRWTGVFGILGVLLAWGCVDPQDPRGNDGTGGAPASGGAGPGGAGLGGAAGSGGDPGTDESSGSAGAAGSGNEDVDPAKRVTARVVNLSGQGLAGVRIDVDGQSGISDEAGRIVFENVAATYDARYVSAGKSDVILWKGVKRRDPVFQVSSSAQLSTNVQGAVTSSVALPGTAIVRVAILCEDGNGTFPAELSNGTNYSIGMPWPAPGEKSCRLLALALDDHTPVGVAAKDITLDESSSLTDQDLELAAPTLRTITIGSQNVSAGAEVFSNAAWGPFAIDPREDSPGAFTLFIPELDPPVRTLLTGTSFGATRPGSVEEDLPADATSVTVDFSKVPSLVDPAPGGSVDEDTVFTWSSPSAAVVHTFYIKLYDVQAIVHTKASSEPFPDFAAAGIEIPPGTPGTWGVISVSSPTTIDGLLGASTRPLPDKRYQAFEQGLVYKE